MDNINDLILQLNDLVSYSDDLLSRETISVEEYTVYKKRCSSIYVLLINKKINITVSELALRGLKFEVKRIKNPLLRWLYMQASTARDNITYNAPFLKRYSEVDYMKQYIFWTKKKIEGLIFNLQSLPEVGCRTK